MAQGGSYIDPPTSSSGYNLVCDPKLLFSESEEHDGEKNEPDTLKVFLRVKPLEATNQKGVLEILDTQTIVTRLPEDTTTHRKKLNKETCRYSFTEVFGPQSKQAYIFNVTAKGHLKDFLNGQNGLIFTYGTTSAGKTYTVQGTHKRPGLIPRALASIFKTLRQGQLSVLPFKPNMVDSIENLTKETAKSLECMKNSILCNYEFQDIKSTEFGTTLERRCEELSEAAAAFKAMETVMDKEVDRISSDESLRNCHFSVWVSFSEIYNEAIFDLLKPVASCGQARKPLKLAWDLQNRCFIKDLTYINVANEEEAYKTYLFGRKNLQIASTSLNKHSSRSHCVFSIVLIKCNELESSKMSQLSRFTICDLAGAERQNKTFNKGDRLVESNNINKSLLVLSRCFNMMREKQGKVNKNVIPFRESKLTNLFQKALCGEENVSMIVNVTPDYNLINETEQVLRTSAVAKMLELQPVTKANIKKPERSRRLSEYFPTESSRAKNTTTSITENPGSIPPDLAEINENISADKHPDTQEVVESLMQSNDYLTKENATLLRKLKEAEEEKIIFECEIRKEVVDSLSEFYNKLLEECRARARKAEQEGRDLRRWKRRMIEEIEEENERKKQQEQNARPFDCSISIIENVNKNDESEVNKLKKVLDEKEEEYRCLVRDQHLLQEENIKLNFELNSEKAKNSEYEEKDRLIEEAVLEIKLREKNEQALNLEIDDLKELVVAKFEKLEAQQKTIDELQCKLVECTDMLAEMQVLREKLDAANKEVANKDNAIIQLACDKKAIQLRLREKDDKIIKLKQAIEDEETFAKSVDKENMPKSVSSKKRHCKERYRQFLRVIDNIQSDSDNEKACYSKRNVSSEKKMKSKSRESVSDTESVRRSKRVASRRQLISSQYCSENEMGTPEDPKDQQIESPLSQFNRIAPLSSKNRSTRNKKKKKSKFYK